MFIFSFISLDIFIKHCYYFAMAKKNSVFLRKTKKQYKYFDKVLKAFLQNEEIVARTAGFILTLKDEEIKDLKINDTAKAAAIDNLELSRTFKNKLGISVTEFIKREIIYRAVFAIDKEPDITINDLAERFGFTTLDEFEKEFFKYYLIKPARYKELAAFRAHSPVSNY